MGSERRERGGHGVGSGDPPWVPSLPFLSSPYASGSGLVPPVLRPCLRRDELRIRDDTERQPEDTEDRSRDPRTGVDNRRKSPKVVRFLKGKG